MSRKRTFDILFTFVILPLSISFSPETHSSPASSQSAFVIGDEDEHFLRSRCVRKTCSLHRKRGRRVYGENGGEEFRTRETLLIHKIYVINFYHFNNILASDEISQCSGMRLASCGM